MNIKECRVLVTGAGGFIGSHLVETFANRGIRVKAFLRYNSRNHYGHLETIGDIRKEIEIITGDLRDKEAVRRAVKGCDVVFHLGALIGIPYSYNNPADVFATNVGGTINVLDAAREFEVEKVVITSTSEVYGTPLYVPIDEKHPLQTQSPYSASKVASDKAGESYFNSFNVPVATIRPFNTFGPRQSARAVIPTIITQALSGDVIKLGSLHPRRDMLFVLDTVNAFITVAESDKSIGKVINFGTGTDISIGDLALEILHLMGKEIKIVTDDQRVRPDSSEVQRLVCNYSKAVELLGWTPRFTLEEGLRKTIGYISEHLSQYKTDIYNV